MRSRKQDEFYGSKSFERQVRRHLRAGEQQFAAIVPPVFVPLCETELATLDIPVTSVFPGGVEFTGRWADCYRANLCLRTASRVLWRLPEFRCGALEALFNHIAKQRLELWLNPSIPLQISVHLNVSRIPHEGEAKETILAGISRRMAQLGLPRPKDFDRQQQGETTSKDSHDSKQRIIARIDHNRCHLSVDTTGPHLHRRGYRRFHTGAPMRETLAAAVLIKAGWTGAVPLVDAMSGSGTVAIEAACLARRLVPGLQRRFLFESWPCFFESTFGNVKVNAAAAIRPRSPSPIIAIELDPGSMGVARENARSAQVDADIRWHTGDLFEFDPADHKLSPGLIVVDPPYGKRLAGGGKEFYKQLGTTLRRKFTGWHAAVLAPQRSWLSQLGVRPLRTWPVPHGGLPVDVALFRIA